MYCSIYKKIFPLSELKLVYSVLQKGGGLCGDGGNRAFCPQPGCCRKGCSFILAENVHVVRHVSEQQAHCCVARLRLQMGHNQAFQAPTYAPEELA